MKNLFAATYTPLDKDGEVNLPIIQNYSKFLQHNGVNGVFVNGSTGDFVSLSTNERIEITNEWAKYKSPEFYLFNHVGHTSLREAKLLARESVGKVDAIAAIAPYYFLPASVDSLLDYCQEIANSAKTIPFYFYHLPALTGVNFSMIEFAEKAMDRIENFKGIKFTQNDIVGFKLVKDKFPELNIFFGVDEGFLPGLSVGASGWVGSTYNQLAPLYNKIYQEFNNGNIEQANILQGKAIAFVNTLAEYGSFNGGGKSFMKYLGVDCGPSRYPHPTLENIDIEKVLQRFEEINLTPLLSESKF